MAKYIGVWDNVYKLLSIKCSLVISYPTRIVLDRVVTLNLICYSTCNDIPAKITLDVPTCLYSYEWVWIGLDNELS